MPLLSSILAALALLALPLVSVAAEHEQADAAHAQITGATHGAHPEGLPAAAPRFKLGPITVTNSMIMTWVVALFVIIFAQTATRNIKAVPEGAQNFWEWLVENLYEFLEGIIGHELVAKTFWFFATVFIFILATNWFGLLPLVGTLGWGVPKAEGSFLLAHVSRPLLRGGNADLN